MDRFSYALLCMSCLDARFSLDGREWGCQRNNKRPVGKDYNRDKKFAMEPMLAFKPTKVSIAKIMPANSKLEFTNKHFPQGVCEQTNYRAFLISNQVMLSSI
jgi:hypothetical protein